MPTLVENAHRGMVGPPDAFDIMGAHQFRILTGRLGLRERHTLLDVGCGCLRAGKLFMVYLERGNYYGIEPDRDLLNAGLTQEAGLGLIAAKDPHFHFTDRFDCRVFGREFDYILAQSIITHFSLECVRALLASARASIADDGVFALTFFPGEDDYSGTGPEYIGIVKYRPQTVIKEAAAARFKANVRDIGHPHKQLWAILRPR